MAAAAGRGGACRLSYLPHAAVAGGRRRSPLRALRDRSHAPVRHRGVQAAWRLEQKRRSVAAAPEGERELRAEPFQPRTLEAVERADLGRGQQSVGRFRRAGIELGLSCGEARTARRAGSGVSSVARCRNAAAAAAPPRACARPAERSISAATASSGPAAACARCHARRSGSASGSVASARARCAALPVSGRGRLVDSGPDKGMTEPHPGTEFDQSRSLGRGRRFGADPLPLGCTP